MSEDKVYIAIKIATWLMQIATIVISIITIIKMN